MSKRPNALKYKYGRTINDPLVGICRRVDEYTIQEGKAF